MTTRLSLYGGALRLLGQRKLASLTENTPARHYLDDAWNGGALDYCLESGQWKFAMRSVMLTYSPSVAPDFGYTYAFDKPTDHLRLGGVFGSPGMTADDALLEYREEAGFWFANLDTIYVRYVSNDAAFGADMSLWPASFTKFVEAHLASEIAMSLTNDEGKLGNMLTMRDKRFLPEALSRDAMQDPPKFAPMSGWTRARMGGGRIRGEGPH